MLMTTASTWEPRIRVHRNVPRLWMFPIRSMYIEAINRAQRNIWMTHAYFIPDEGFVDALVEAAARGVDVRLLLPAKSNHIVADWISRGYFRRMLDAGVAIHRFRDAMVHAKTATIDGNWTTIGTANVDRLSMSGNYEINVEIIDASLAEEMERIFETDLTNALAADHRGVGGAGRLQPVHRDDPEAAAAFALRRPPNATDTGSDTLLPEPLIPSPEGHMTTETAANTTPDHQIGGPDLPQERRVVTEIPGPRSRELHERRGGGGRVGGRQRAPGVRRRGRRRGDRRRRRQLADRPGQRHRRRQRRQQRARGRTDGCTDQVAAFTHTCFMVAPYEGYVEVCEKLAAAHPRRPREEGRAVQLRRRGRRERRQDRARAHRSRRGRGRSTTPTTGAPT